MPNFLKCRIPVQTQLKPKVWAQKLQNYWDQQLPDLIAFGFPLDFDRSKILMSYHDLLQLLQDLGLEVSQSKLVPPSTQVICLGILVDTVQKTLSIPEDKLKDIINMVDNWQGRKKCTRNQFQSLLGSLLYIIKCVHPAQYFLNRMLVILRDNKENRYISLDTSFFQDLNWFQQFLRNVNGVTYFDNRKPQGEIHLDASLTGFGACYDNMVYALPLPESFHEFHITQLEMLNVIVALKVWSTVWQN